MPVNMGWLKKQASVALSISVLFVFVLGVLAFALALRPCHLAFQPGQVISYKLTSTSSELMANGKPGAAHTEVRGIDLVCTGGDNEMALICAAADGSARNDQVTLLEFSPDGASFKLDAAARPSDSGAAIGFFDFNLLPLPEGSEQPREVTVNYAVLPPGRNPVQGRVRRTKSGTKPVFQLKLQSSVEWLSADNRYHQIRDLVSTYRFNTAKGVVDDATIKLVAGVERDDGAHRYLIEMSLKLDGAIGHTDEDPRRLREAVLASADAQELLRSDDHGRSAAVAERLRTAAIGLPQLRALADRLSDAILRPEPAVERAWCVRLASGSPRERTQAETLKRQVIAAGYPAYLKDLAGSRLAVLVGPYQTPDPMVLSTLAKAYPGFAPAWMEMPR